MVQCGTKQLLLGAVLAETLGIMWEMQSPSVPFWTLSVSEWKKVESDDCLSTLPSFPSDSSNVLPCRSCFGVARIVSCPPLSVKTPILSLLDAKVHFHRFVEYQGSKSGGSGSPAASIEPAAGGHLSPFAAAARHPAPESTASQDSFSSPKSTPTSASDYGSQTAGIPGLTDVGTGHQIPYCMCHPS